MCHLRSQKKTVDTLKLVSQVYLLRCRRIIRDTTVTQGEQQQRGRSGCQNQAGESHMGKAVMSSLPRTDDF